MIIMKNRKDLRNIKSIIRDRTAVLKFFDVYAIL